MWTAIAFGLGGLGALRLNAAIHLLGIWALRFLFLSLLITPAKEILHWARLVQVRRMVGVAAFAYALAHLLFYVAEQSFDVATVADEIFFRGFLTVGLAALLGLALLAATSTDKMMKKLGGRRWRRLHRLVYAIAVVATLHYLQQLMLGEREPIVMLGLLYWLLLYRLLGVTLAQGPLGLFSVVLMSIAAAVLTALTEASLISVASGVAFGRVLVLNFSLELGIRPAWIVALPGIILACAGIAPRYQALTGMKTPSASAVRPLSRRP
ncbi:sulfite oxidase heme-binding subunit YedZ [Methylocapsa palsarum]|uniref:sulfite oxidase heme-binding subunit YedZ n=1 Tax=Methylocapsa palsarum TaxID=1612308 RepID=UPI0015871F9B|nr:ferric reductase-like transmembrane domain-containing protein [Methylocapsa palsarum]